MELDTYNVLGIDTGLRESLGCTIVSLSFRYNDLLSIFLDIFFKRNRILKVTSDRMRVFLSSILGFKSTSVRVIFASVFNFSGNNRRDVVRRIFSVAKESEVKSIAIEDFLYFSGLSEKYKNRRDRRIDVASWYIVSRVQNVIGYLTGYAEANGFSVYVFTPRSWQSLVSSLVDPEPGALVSKFLHENRMKLKRNHVDHVYAAAGIALACLGVSLYDKFRNDLDSGSLNKKFFSFYRKGLAPA